SLRLIFPANLRELAAQLVREAVDTSSPAIAPANNRGLDKEALPTPWRPKLSVADRRIGRRRRRVRRRGYGGVACIVRRVRGDALGVGRDPEFAPRRSRGASASGRGVGYLTEREILGELPGRQSFGSALDQGEEGAPASIRPHRAACEMDWNIG